ncbi:MAG: hypothetical protein ACK50A_05200 [Sphingobacteriaceae bacterium]
MKHYWIYLFLCFYSCRYETYTDYVFLKNNTNDTFMVYSFIDTVDFTNSKLFEIKNQFSLIYPGEIEKFGSSSPNKSSYIKRSFNEKFNLVIINRKQFGGLQNKCLKEITDSNSVRLEKYSISQLDSAKWCLEIK